MTKKSLTNNNLSFISGNVKFTVPENALIDTFRFRVGYVSTPRRKFDEYQIDNTSVLVNRRRPAQANGWHGYNDIQTSVAKYLGGGENNQVEFTDYRRRDYKKHHTAIFTALQNDIGKASGIGFNIFDAMSSRLHTAVNLQCESFADAERLRDYFFETVNLRYLTDKRRHKATCYWNCPSYKGSGKPNQCFAIYPTGNNKLRFEYRRNNMRSVQDMFKTKFAKVSKLENNFKSLSKPETMNRIFWNTAIYFFNSEDRKIIVKSFSLDL